MGIAVKIRAEDPATGEVVGWRRHGRIVPEKRHGTWYNTPSSVLLGLESAEKRWPQYRWRVFDWKQDVEMGLERRPKQRFTREEVLALLAEERGRFALALTKRLVMDMPTARAIVDEVCEPLKERLP